ncbi:hypothetical protein M758_UG185500 [Ceratodon purpureus]|nr:hypothetical protein M758_UG185500 [Ceratodon purpureus]
MENINGVKRLAPNVIIDQWLRILKCTARQRKRALSCLNVEHLRRLPLVGKSRPWPGNPENRNFRYHFQAQVAHIIHWKERHTFLKHIDDLLREILWPDNVIAIEVEGGREGSKGGKSGSAQPQDQTPSEKTCEGGASEVARGYGGEPPHGAEHAGHDCGTCGVCNPGDDCAKWSGWEFCEGKGKGISCGQDTGTSKKRKFTESGPRARREQRLRGAESW